MRKQITKFAKSLGFDLVGFSPARIEDKYLKGFDKWLGTGKHGGMHYMEKIEQRRDLTNILPNAKSVICLAFNYYYDQNELKQSHGRVARYAYGRDYHKSIKKKLRQLTSHLNEIAPEHQHKAYVDTGPILERALAEQAGLGVIGKNSCLITPKYGSWVFLAELITTLDLVEGGQKRHNSPRPFKIPTHICGNCTRCVDACPTGAIVEPGVIDSRLCISYLTIENRDKIPKGLAKIIAETKSLYGCDICQEVCPHNQARQRSHDHDELVKPIAGDQLDIQKIKSIDSEIKYLELFAGSPLMRAKKSGLQRNADTIST